MSPSVTQSISGLPKVAPTPSPGRCIMIHELGGQVDLSLNPGPIFKQCSVGQVIEPSV